MKWKRKDLFCCELVLWCKTEERKNCPEKAHNPRPLSIYWSHTLRLYVRACVSVVPNGLLAEKGNERKRKCCSGHVY